MPLNIEAGIGEPEDEGHSPSSLLRPRRERPRNRRAADERDKVAPFHCPILPCFQQKG
jgi:hypothetical protein